MKFLIVQKNSDRTYLSDVRPSCGFGKNERLCVVCSELIKIIKWKHFLLKVFTLAIRMIILNKHNMFSPSPHDDYQRWSNPWKNKSSSRDINTTALQYLITLTFSKMLSWNSFFYARCRRNYHWKKYFASKLPKLTKDPKLEYETW